MTMSEGSPSIRHCPVVFRRGNPLIYSLLEFNGEASGGAVVVVGDRHVSLSCVVVECSCLTSMRLETDLI